jgi:sec-independent protein translocase protein TatA
LRNIGEDLGGAVKGFKEGMKSEEDSHKQLAQDGKTIEGEAKEKTQTKV